MAKVLIVGLGFIATHAAAHLSKNNDVVVTYRSLEGVKGIYGKILEREYSVKLVKLDPINDLDEVRRLIKSSDTVINAVGVIKGGPADFKRAHVEVPRVLARAIAEESPSTMLIHLSASNVMGPIGQFVGEEARHCEGARPSNIYEETKCEGEKVVYNEASRAGFPLAIVRPTFVYGRYAAHRQFALIYRLAKRGLVPRLSVNMMAISAPGLASLLEALHKARPRLKYLYATECRPVNLTEFFRLMAEALGVRYVKVPVPEFAVKLFTPRELRPLYKYSKVIYDCAGTRSLVGDLTFREDEVRENALFLRELDKLGLI